MACRVYAAGSMLADRITASVLHRLPDATVVL